jgi:AraC-like DNA-binding protein
MYSLFVNLKKQLSELESWSRSRHRRVSFGSDLYLTQGFETRTDPSKYEWIGDRRAHPHHPEVIFQYTLDGLGAFEQRDITHEARAGSTFVAIFPSPHRYYLPQESPSWTFMWFVVRHPYLVERIRLQLAISNPVITSSPDSKLVTRLLSLFKSVAHDQFLDVFAWESALFDLMLEYERTCQQQAQTQFPTNRMLEEIRTEVRRRLEMPITVDSLARQYNLSRSAFTHQFKNATGRSPARYVVEIKLQEVTNRLRHGDEKLESISSACGFADANHLCKVFRRFYHTTPGQYREQFR